MSSSLNDPMWGKVGSTAVDKEIALRPNIQYTHLVTFHEDDMLPFLRRPLKNCIFNPSMKEETLHFLWRLLSGVVFTGGRSSDKAAVSFDQDQIIRHCRIGHFGSLAWKHFVG
jgi:hypothetical protein